VGGAGARAPGYGTNCMRGMVLLGLVGGCLLGCGDDGAAKPPPPGADSGVAPGSDSGLTDGGPPPRPPCPNPPIPEGELQNRASGPSVFGQILGGDAHWFDLLGGTDCGLAGARICQLSTDNCTESDQAGQFVLAGLPENQDIEIAFEKPGSAKVLRPLHTGLAPINLEQVRLLNEDSQNDLLAKAGAVVDPNKGALVASGLAPGEAIGGFTVPEGVVITLKPSGPTPLYTVGSEPITGLSSGEFDPALVATRFGGWAYFNNVEPGGYAVRFERNGQVCNVAVPGFGYGADAEGNVRVKVIAGYGTGIIVGFCL
jgi:hypothetical protein